ncbi:MAG TPA: hypothetical protein VE913_08100 [Longimicrobium sp.]|nr:hypothetical protein [Longimicrobium sp.]
MIVGIGTTEGSEAGGGPSWRALFLGLVLLGMMGLMAELLLLEHFESAWQWAPLVALGLGMAACVALLLRPARGTVRFFQAMMIVFVAAGAVGVFLHLRGNAEFEREMERGLGGVRLFWRALSGATPALAPGAMAHMGLLGLACCYRHPALRPVPSTPTTTPEEMQ